MQPAVASRKHSRIWGRQCYLAPGLQKIDSRTGARRTGVNSTGASITGASSTSASISGISSTGASASSTGPGSNLLQAQVLEIHCKW